MVEKLDNSVASSSKARMLSAALRAFVLGFFVLALLSLSLHFISYGKAKALFEIYVAAHGAQGGAGNDLKEEAYNRLVRRLPIAASIFGLCGAVLALFRRRLATFLLDVPSGFKTIPLRNKFHQSTEATLEIAFVLIVFSFGLFLRLRYLYRPVRFDEAWTYVDFASHPLVLALSRYSAPNNHLLNTLLVHLSTELFGNTLFALRLPAFLAGSIVILVAWFVTREIYGPSAGILAAGGVAVLPAFIEFSVNARGYALQWFFILGCTWFAVVVQENPSRKTAWLGLIVTAVAGIYSIPTTVIAVGGIFTWMLASTLADEKAVALKDQIRNLSLAAVAIALLSLLLYLPPLLVSGPRAVAAQNIMAFQREGDFAEGLHHMGVCAWVYWTEGVPAVILWTLFAGLLLGLLFDRQASGHRVPITLAMLLVAVIFAWSRHIFAFPRVWSYILLNAVMTAAAGISLALKYLAGPSRIRQIAVAGTASVALVAFVAIGLVRQRVMLTTDETSTISDADEIVRFLSSELRPGDSLVSNALIEYDLLQRDPRLYASLSNPEGAARLMAVVVKHTGSTEWCGRKQVFAILAAQDIADPALLGDRVDLSAYGAPHVRAKFLTSTVFSFERKPTAP